ncbi:hypothetical protein LTR27_008704 [Elasticomyces elasticus]|nr:hypothetical protein LTR27_008704 [Elasticomyces elasticus]
MISIGTGAAPGPSLAGNLKDLMKALAAIVTQTSTAANNFFSDNKDMADSGRYYRFNVLHGLAEVGLEEWKEIAQIAGATNTYLNDPETNVKWSKCVAKLLEIPNRGTDIPAFNPDSVSRPQGAMGPSLQGTRTSAETLSLLAPGPADDLTEFIYTKEQRAEGTCTWLLQDVAYKSWLKDEHSLLWINGLPGQGKSMLALFAIDSLQGLITAQSQEACTFFYWESGKAFRNTAVRMLRSILYQLLRRFPTLFDHMIDDYERQGTDLFSENSFVPLWRMLFAMIGDRLVQRVYCVLDGLDECEAGSRERLLNFLRDWLTASPAGPNREKLKILLFSQPLSGKSGQHQLEIQKKCPSISLGSTETVSDVHKYITARLSSLETQQFSSERLARMRKELLARSGNTFLWAAAVLGQIEELPPDQAEKAVHKAPLALDKLYRKILGKLNPLFLELARHATLWISSTIRPLTKMELAMALEVHKNPKMIRLPTTGVLREIDLLLSHCKSLFLVREPEETVHLLHHTLASHLVATSSTQNQFEIAQVLVRNLCLDDFKDVKLKKPSAYHFWSALTFVHNDANINPLRRYACEHWMDHFAECKDLLDEFDFGFFFSSPMSYHFKPLEFHLENFHTDPLKWFRCRVYWEKETKQVQTMHMFVVACEKECHAFIEGFFRRNQSKRQAHRVPILEIEALIKSAELGHAAIVGLLLDNGVDVNSTLDKDPHQEHADLAKYYRFKEQTALHVSSRVGHYSVVRTLLQANADLSLKDGEGLTALHIAVNEQRHDIVEILLKSGNAGVNSSDSELQTPLHHAAKATGAWLSGQYAKKATRGELARLLLSCGTDTASRDGEGATPLHYAACQNEREVGSALLDSGAQVDAQDDQGRTALHDAAQCGFSGFVALLLSRGFSVSATDHDGISPLHSAARGGSVLAALELLEHDGNVSCTDYSGGTPLHKAAACGSWGVVELLVQFGADVLATDKEGGTALHCAAGSTEDVDHNLKILKYLIDRDDTALTMQDKAGRTPLAVANVVLGQENREVHYQDFSGHTSIDSFPVLYPKLQLACEYLREQCLVRHFTHLALVDPEVQDPALYYSGATNEIWGSIDIAGDRAGGSDSESA